MVQSPSFYRRENNYRERTILDDILEVMYVSNVKGKKRYFIKDCQSIENDIDEQNLHKIFSSDSIYEIEDMNIVLLIAIIASFDRNSVTYLYDIVKHKNVDVIKTHLENYDVKSDVFELIEFLCDSDINVDFSEFNDAIETLHNLNKRIKINIYKISTGSNIRTSVTDKFKKVETYSMFDVLYKSNNFDLPSHERILPFSLFLVKFEGKLKAFYIHDLSILFFHLTKKNNPSYNSVCPICEYRFTDHLSKAKMQIHMENCTGKKYTKFMFDETRFLKHRPSDLKTIKPPFILSGDFETIREDKTMKVISYALNVIFLDIDTGILNTVFNVMRSSFTIVCDYISYKNVFDNLPVELRMFFNDDLQKIRNDIITKYENNEISLGGVCLIDIFILDIMSREFLRRIYYTNRDLRKCLSKSNKTYDEFKNDFQTQDTKCYQCNTSIDYEYNKTQNILTINSFKEIFKKYLISQYGCTLSKYRLILNQYDVIFDAYLVLLHEADTPHPIDMDSFHEKLTEFNVLYGLSIDFSTVKNYVGYLHNYYVLHYHPFSGIILGPSHRICNLSQVIYLDNIKTSIYFHNIGFDSLFFLNQIIPEILEFFGDKEISMIFNGAKLKYMFSDNFDFKDSYSIFQCSASVLFDTFNKEDQEYIVQQCFMNLYDNFSEHLKKNYNFNELYNDFKIMCQGKGISLYDNVCKGVLESKTPFPSRYMFRSTLKEFQSEDKLYDIFKNLYDKYGFNFKEYGLLDFNDFYNMLDSELLSHAIRMITTAEEAGKVYTVRHTSIPTSARSLIVYSSNAVLRYLPTENLYEIFRTTKIGGYSGVHVPITYNTECFKNDTGIISLPYSATHVKLDVNSLYPFMMVKYNYATGPYRHVTLPSNMTDTDTVIEHFNKIKEKYQKDNIDLDFLINYDIEFTHIDKFYTYSPVVVKKEIDQRFLSSYQRLMSRNKLRSGKYVYTGTKGVSVYPVCHKINKWGYLNQMIKEMELEYTVTNIRHYVVFVVSSFLKDEISKIIKIRQALDVKPATSMMAKLKANSASGVFGMESENKPQTRVLFDPVLNKDKKAAVKDIKKYYSDYDPKDDIVMDAIKENKCKRKLGSHYCTIYDDERFDERVKNRIDTKNVKTLKLWQDAAEKSVFKGFVEEIAFSKKVKSLLPINTKILAESKITVGLFYKRVYDDFKKEGITVYNCYTDTDSLKLLFHKDGDSNDDEFSNYILDRFKKDYPDCIDFSNIKNHPHYDPRFKKHLGYWQHENGSDTKGYNKVKSLIATSPKSYHVTFEDDTVERKAKGVKGCIDISINYYLDHFVDVSCFYNSIDKSSDEISKCYDKIEALKRHMNNNKITQHQFKNSMTSNIKIQEIDKKAFGTITNKTYRLGNRGEVSIIHGHPVLKDVRDYLNSVKRDDLFSDETIKRQYQLECDMITNSQYLSKCCKFFSEYTSRFINFHLHDRESIDHLKSQYQDELLSDEDV